MCPDASGRFLGISVPELPWLREPALALAPVTMPEPSSVPHVTPSGRLAARRAVGPPRRLTAEEVARSPRAAMRLAGATPSPLAS